MPLSGTTRAALLVPLAVSVFASVAVVTSRAWLRTRLAPVVLFVCEERAYELLSLLTQYAAVNGACGAFSKDLEYVELVTHWNACEPLRVPLRVFEHETLTFSSILEVYCGLSRHRHPDERLVCDLWNCAVAILEHRLRQKLRDECNGVTLYDELGVGELLAQCVLLRRKYSISRYAPVGEARKLVRHFPEDLFQQLSHAFNQERSLRSGLVSFAKLLRYSCSPARLVFLIVLILLTPDHVSSAIAGIRVRANWTPLYVTELDRALENGKGALVFIEKQLRGAPGNLVASAICSSTVVELLHCLRSGAIQHILEDIIACFHVSGYLALATADYDPLNDWQLVRCVSQALWKSSGATAGELEGRVPYVIEVLRSCHAAVCFPFMALAMYLGTQWSNLLDNMTEALHHEALRVKNEYSQAFDHSNNDDVDSVEFENTKGQHSQRIGAERLTPIALIARRGPSDEKCPEFGSLIHPLHTTTASNFSEHVQGHYGLLLLTVMWFESGIGQDNRYNLLVRHLVLPDITSVLAKSALASLRHSISRETIQTPGFHKLKWMLAAVRNAHRSGRSGARAGGRVLGRGEDYMELVALRMRGLALTVAKEAPSTVSPQDSDEGIETLTRDLLCAVFQTADAMPLLLTAVAALHLSPRFLEQSAQEQDTVMCRLRLFQRVVSQAQFQNAVFFPGGTLREWQADELRVRQSLERSGGSLGCYRIVERMWTVQHQIDRPLASVPPSLDGPWSVEFRDVSFRYGEGRPYVLRNVSFFVNKREFLGIAGCSGAGKTTLLRLLNRTFAPTSGDILINGRHISCYPVRLLRRRVANVWQEEIGLKFLDALTVSQNVALGDLRRCGSTDISSALRSAGALSFLQKRSLGPGTPMHSHKFSGGEVERLSLARAFMKYNTDAGLLVLDEPMSAVDATTERRLFRALGLVERRMPNRAATVVLVTHRLASLRCADTIVILNNGVVDQIGNWTTLCGSGRDSSFSKMLASQQCLASTN